MKVKTPVAVGVGVLTVAVLSAVAYRRRSQIQAAAPQLKVLPGQARRLTSQQLAETKIKLREARARLAR